MFVDFNVEYDQLGLFLLYSLNLMQKEFVLLENKAVRCSEAVKTSIKDYQLLLLRPEDSTISSFQGRLIK